MASMWMQTPEESVKSLFHDPVGENGSSAVRGASMMGRTGEGDPPLTLVGPLNSTFSGGEYGKC